MLAVHIREMGFGVFGKGSEIMKIRGTGLIVVFILVLSSFFRASAERKYFAIFMDGKRCGHAIHSRVVANKQVRTSEQVKFKMDRFGTPVEVSTSETCIETVTGKPLGFEVTQDMSAFRTIIKATVSADGKVDVTTTTGQIEQKKNFDWPEGGLMAEGLRLLELKHGLEEGTEYSLKLFSPSMMQAMDSKVKIGAKKQVDLLGRVLNLTEVTSIMTVPFTGEITTTSYTDDELSVLKTITPMMGMQLEMLACSKDFALSEAEPFEFVSKAFIKSPKPFKELSSVKAIEYRIRPAEEAKDFKIPSSDNQQVKEQQDGTLIVTVRPVTLPSEAEIGYRGSDAEVRKSLKSNRFIQSDDEKIQQLAKEAIGDTKNAAVAAKRIEQFVSEYIEDKNLSIGYASAAEVAESRQGDCTEFAVLTAALCRAAGIPARIVVGVAYVDEFMGYEEVFGGHSWTEAYVGDKWIGLDSSFKAWGGSGYDAGHIALATGSGELEDFFSLVFSIGQFEIEEVTIER